MGGLGGRRPSGRSSYSSGFSSFSTDEVFHAYNFPEPIPETIPSVVFNRGVPPPTGGHLYVPASVASPTAPAVSPLRSLPHGDHSTSSALDLTLSGWPTSAGLAPPVAVPSPSPASASSSSSSPSTVAPKPSLRQAKPFKLPEINDAKGYLDIQDIAKYYLHTDDYGTLRADDLLLTDSANAEASHYWEGQLRVAIKNGGLCFLFENTGSRFHRKGFEMLAVLNQHCRPDSVTNAFTTLMSLFNAVQGDSEPIVEF